jgi:hypothetical protein
VAATSVDTGEVIDVESLSKFCHKCKKNTNNEAHELNCVSNYTAASGGMEAEGALLIF